MVDINNPTTYAEWFWKNSVDASAQRAEDIEKALAPIVAGIVDSLPDKAELPPVVATLLNTIKTPEHPALDNVLFKFVADLSSGLAQRILGHEVKGFDYKVNAYLQNELITPQVANTLKMRNKISDELWLARQHAGGLSELEGAFIYESQKPYPALADIITYGRYRGNAYNPRERVFELFDVTPTDWDMWDWLSWQKLNTEQVQALYKRKYWNDVQVTEELAKLGWQSEDRAAVLELSYSLPNPMILMQGALMQEADSSTIRGSLAKADIHPDYVQTYVDAILTKPSTQDVIAYELRKDPSLANLHRRLRRIGIHNEYNDLYRELAYQIPPVADIITMAVREAFTPEIASKFGQYEGLPKDYVDWVQKKGLSKDWAERYWASHWSLPSPQQGFEMLHRGIINRSELLLLLRALDIMPFWRDKLIEMAYRPLTRVDVRRMYGLGVLDKEGILKAYKDLGYRDDNASLMTEFTLQYTRQSLSRFSSNDVITAYKKRFIDSGQATNLLRDIGIKSEEIPRIIETATLKRDWQAKEERITAIENLYKKGKMSYSQARSNLGNLNLPSDHIETLLQQWESKSEAEKVSLWTTAQTLSFVKAGLINSDRAKKELVALGYDEEHIGIYLQSTIPQEG